jgi:ABC-type antimicrobial peptide transport system permease subunit
MSETLSFSIRFAIIGILIVFGCLALIVGCISLIRRLDRRWQARESAETESALNKSPSIDTTTLILISAAVATMLQGRFYIRKVRRLLPRDAMRGPWSMQGRAILHGSHVVSKKR